jgi:signal transduction histidine kinase
MAKGKSSGNRFTDLVARVPVRIRTKLLVAFATMVLLLLGVGTLGQGVLSDSNDRLETAGRLQQSLALYRLLQADNIALQQVVASRVVGDIREFAGETPSTPRKESVEPVLRRLRDFYDLGKLHFAPTAAERRVLHRIEGDYQQFVKALTTSIEFEREGKTAEAEQLVIAEAKPLLTRLGRATDELAYQTETVIAGVTGENRAAFASSRRLFLLSAAMASVLALLFGFAISSSIIGPVQRMDARLAEIAAGDFSGHLQVRNRDELGRLAANVNHMNDDLGGLYDVVQRQAATLTEWNQTLEARVDEQSDQLRASRARIVAAADAERRRIERNLHDGAQQHLVALAVNLNLARRELADDPEVSATMLEQLVGDVRATIEDLRNLAHGIYPPLLLESGLPAAVSAAAARSSLEVSVVTDGVGRQSPDVEAAVYFCCLEALQNAAKHAEGAAVAVRIWEEPGALAFEVADDGPGFDPVTVTHGQGLVNMGDRLAAVGGAARWESYPGRGTKVCGSLPVSD